MNHIINIYTTEYTKSRLNFLGIQNISYGNTMMEDIYLGYGYLLVIREVLKGIDGQSIGENPYYFFYKT